MPDPLTQKKAETPAGAVLARMTRCAQQALAAVRPMPVPVPALEPAAYALYQTLCMALGALTTIAQWGEDALADQGTPRHYTPDASGVCTHCGVAALSHAASGRCLSFEEVRERLRVYVATGQWPTCDEADDPGLDPAVAREFGLWDAEGPAPCPWCGEPACEGRCTPQEEPPPCPS